MVVEYLVSAENATVCQNFSVADLQLMRTWKILGKEHISWTGRLWANSSSFISVFTGYPIRIYCCPKSENSIFSLSNYLSESPNKQSRIGSLSFYWSTQSGVLKNVQCLNWTIQPLKVAKLILAFYVLNCRAYIGNWTPEIWQILQCLSPLVSGSLDLNQKLQQSLPVPTQVEKKQHKNR